MSCSFKDPATGVVCGVITSINPETKQHYEYCRNCFVKMRRNRQERFVNASRKVINRRECLWVGNFAGKVPFRVKCIESPIHNGWCGIHKEVVASNSEESKEPKEPNESDKSKKSKSKHVSEKNVDDALSQFITSKKDKKGKLKALTENPELSEDDNVVVISNKSTKKIRETITKPDDGEIDDTDEVKDTKKTSTKKSKKSAESKEDNPSHESETDQVVKKSTKKSSKKSK